MGRLVMLTHGRLRGGLHEAIRRTHAYLCIYFIQRALSPFFRLVVLLYLIALRRFARLISSSIINYRQAYRTIQVVLTKMYRDEAASFAKFLAYVEQFEDADPNNYYKIKKHKETGSGSFLCPLWS
jgi:hypothetical protein